MRRTNIYCFILLIAFIFFYQVFPAQTWIPQKMELWPVMDGVMENFAVYYAVKILTFQEEEVLISQTSMCVEYQERGVLII